MPSDRAWSHFSTSIPPGALKVIGKLNVPIYRLSRGRIMGTVAKVPALLLTTIGRRSGQPRTAPVLFLADGPNLVVIGSNAGNPKEPAWSHNLKANPNAEVQIRGERRKVTARVALGQERAQLWQSMNSHYGGFDAYDEPPSRDIPVFVPEPR